jgi:hypothetical protein
VSHQTEPGAAPAKRAGCVRRSAGCLAIAIVTLVVVALFLPGTETKLVRRTLAPGMSVEEVVERTLGWLSCRASAAPADEPEVHFNVSPRSYRPPLSDEEHTFATSAEMARALAEEMAGHDTEWTLTFGYITMSPRRIYFDVTFSPDGRVVRVSEIRWGVLD